MKVFAKTVSFVATVLVVSFISTQLWGLRAEEATMPRSDSSMAQQDGGENNQRLREGTQIEDVLGKFEVIGDRISFYPSESNEPLRALENLALERVALQLSGLSRKRVWRVSGTVTEFQGGNYLLVERAILKASGNR